MSLTGTKNNGTALFHTNHMVASPFVCRQNIACANYNASQYTLRVPIQTHTVLPRIDRGACHSTSPSINAGLDLEMPRGVHFTEENIMAALDSKNITTDRKELTLY